MEAGDETDSMATGPENAEVSRRFEPLEWRRSFDDGGRRVAWHVGAAISPLPRPLRRGWGSWVARPAFGQDFDPSGACGSRRSGGAQGSVLFERMAIASLATAKGKATPEASAGSSSTSASTSLASAVAFLKAAVAYYASLGVTVAGVMTDNGSCYKAFDFRGACRDLGLKYIRTKASSRPPCANGPTLRLTRLRIAEQRSSQSGSIDITGIAPTAA
jgi:hypothetical protein